MVLGRCIRGGDDVVEEIIIAGRMAFHFVMVLVGLPGKASIAAKREGDYYCLQATTHRIEASLAEYFFLLRFLLQLQVIKSKFNSRYQYFSHH